MLTGHPRLFFSETKKKFTYDVRTQLTFDIGGNFWNCWDDAFSDPTWGAALGTPNHQNQYPDMGGL